MRNWIGGLGLIWVIFSGAGCTMCCHPYDDCGPVYDVCEGQPVCSLARCGSILENGGMPLSAARNVVPVPSKVPPSPFTEPKGSPQQPTLTPEPTVVPETAGVSQGPPEPMPGEEPAELGTPEGAVQILSAGDQGFGEGQVDERPANSPEGPSLWIALPGESRRR
jgi:hypothetical protein